MRQQTLGRKSQNQWKKIVSTESTLTIKKGSPVFLSLGSKGGYGVKSAESLAVAEQGFFFGLAIEDVAPGAESTSVYGYYAYARMVFASRSATDAVWASTVAIALGDILAVLTVTGVQAVSRSAAGAALTNAQAIIAAETVASTTTAASTLTAAAVGGALYSTGYLKVFVKIM